MPANDGNMRKIGLVLGGGGARGVAHLGVVKALSELGYEPDAIAGCSMGAIVGAMVCKGMVPDEVISAFQDVQAHDLLDFGAMGGIIGGKRIEKKIAEYVPETFEELKIPLKVTAVDVQTGRLVIFGSGQLVPALRASRMSSTISSSHSWRCVALGRPAPGRRIRFSLPLGRCGWSGLSLPIASNSRIPVEIVRRLMPNASAT